MFTGGVCQLWAVIDSKGFTRRVSWGRCRVCYHWPITCLLAGRGSGTLKAWSTDTFTLRTFVFQFRECQVHVCLFSRGNWVSLFWMRGQYLHVPALRVYSWTLTAPPSLWERGLLKLDQNMPAVVAASELPLPRKDMRQFQEKETCMSLMSTKRGQHWGTEAGGLGSEDCGAGIICSLAVLECLHVWVIPLRSFLVV